MPTGKVTPQYVLHVYRSVSRHLSGRVFDGEVEVCAVAGYATVEEVKAAIEDAGQRVDLVVDADPGQAL